MTSAQSGGSLDFSAFYNVIDGKFSPTKETPHGVNPATEESNPEVTVSTPGPVEAVQDNICGEAKGTVGVRRRIRSRER